MTTIYTKPQIDAMAVKIGGEIKAAKTTITQVQGQSTTYAVSQKMITDSLSAFGTAAYKNVGAAAGNVMEVGAGGILGQGLDIFLDTQAMLTKLRATGSTVFRNVESSTSVYKSFGVGFFASVDGSASGYTVSPFGEGVTFFTDRNNNQTTYELWTNKNTPSSNLPVASIQAGIGAPKIAYKKLTGITNIGSNTPHGLDASKILSISGSYLDGVVYLALTPDWDATEIDISSISGGFSYKLLITYEV